MNDKNKSIKNFLNCTLSTTSERNEHLDGNCIIKKVEIKISKETNEGDDHSNKKIVRTGIKHVNSNIEGRLQFFKDGKFIFELARSRKGDKCGWIPVPKNILESSSVRCKNNDSSKYLNEIELTQSFLAQCNKKWKQQIPQKSKCRNLDFFFKRTKNFILSTDGEKLSFKKRRQPLNKSFCDRPFKIIDLGNQSLVGKGKTEKKNITIVLQKLMDKILVASKCKDVINLTYGNVNNYSYMKLKDFQHRQHVSPRKRILRELEKVSLDDATKRSRAKETLKNDVTVDQTNTKYDCTLDGMQCKKINNDSSEKFDKSCSSNSFKLYSSYSINSLLGNCKNQINDSISEIQKSSTKPELTISNIRGKKMIVKSNINLGKDSLDNIGVTLTEKNVDVNKTSFESSDVDVSSPLNYSKYFNIDRISTNFQSSIPNQHFYQSFPTFFSSPSPPQISSSQNNNLQSLSAFSAVPKVSQEKFSHKVLKGDKFSTLLEDSSSKLKKYNVLTESHNGSDVSHKHDTKLSQTNLQSSNSAITAPSMFRTYSQNGTPSISNTFYLPHLSYYHPYATSAMRHQLWMHYQSEIQNNAVDRLSPALFCLNGFNSYSSIDSVHVLPAEHYEKRIPSVQETSDAPISLCVKDSKEECCSDVPLNLSKH